MWLWRKYENSLISHSPLSCATCLTYFDDEVEVIWIIINDNHSSKDNYFSKIPLFYAACFFITWGGTKIWQREPKLSEFPFYYLTFDIFDDIDLCQRNEMTWIAHPWPDLALRYSLANLESILQMGGWFEDSRPSQFSEYDGYEDSKA